MSQMFDGVIQICAPTLSPEGVIGASVSGPGHLFGRYSPQAILGYAIAAAKNKNSPYRWLYACLSSDVREQVNILDAETVCTVFDVALLDALDRVEQEQKMRRAGAETKHAQSTRIRSGREADYQEALRLAGEGIAPSAVRKAKKNSGQHIRANTGISVTDQRDEYIRLAQKIAPPKIVAAIYNTVGVKVEGETRSTFAGLKFIYSTKGTGFSDCKLAVYLPLHPDRTGWAELLLIVALEDPQPGQEYVDVNVTYRDPRESEERKTAKWRIPVDYAAMNYNTREGLQAYVSRAVQFILPRIPHLFGVRINPVGITGHDGAFRLPKLEMEGWRGVETVSEKPKESTAVFTPEVPRPANVRKSKPVIIALLGDNTLNAPDVGSVSGSLTNIRTRVRSLNPAAFTWRAASAVRPSGAAVLFADMASRLSPGETERFCAFPGEPGIAGRVVTQSPSEGSKKALKEIMGDMQHDQLQLAKKLRYASALNSIAPKPNDLADVVLYYDLKNPTHTGSRETQPGEIESVLSVGLRYADQLGIPTVNLAAPGDDRMQIILNAAQGKM